MSRKWSIEKLQFFVNGQVKNVLDPDLGPDFLKI